MFCGKRTDTNGVVYGYVTKMWGQLHIVDVEDENIAYPVISETIGRFSGLRDRSGRAMYELDKYRHPKTGLTGVVIFEEGCFFMRWADGQKEYLHLASNYAECISDTQAECGSTYFDVSDLEQARNRSFRKTSEDKLEKFTCFWRTKSPFSQWHSAKFIVDGIKYNCAEQYMMHQKAMLFNDAETAQEILNVSEPSKQKALGRKVKNFNSKIWDQHCKQIVYEGNKAKFTQNPILLKALIDTKDTTLVEASPYDTIWGVGLAAEDDRINDRKNWHGTN
jgi:conserved hypothetical protein, ribA/ribD-fused